jgi:type I restriction enzyme S subunit
MREGAENGWRSSSFGTLCVRIVNGGTPDTGNSEYWNGKVPWITGADFSSDGIGEVRRFVSDSGIRRSATSVVKRGNLLVVTRTGVGKLAIAPCDIAISQDITGVYVDCEQVDTKFLYYLLRRELDEIKKLNQGTSINGIVRSDLEKHVVQLPSSKAVQCKIAAVLSSIDVSIERTEALIAKYQQIKTGLMHDLFTRGVLPNGQLRPSREKSPELYRETAIGWVPRDWRVGSIESVLARIIDYRGKTPEKSVSGIPLITAKNVRMGFIDPEPKEFIEESDYNGWMTRGIPNPGDVLFTTEAPLGNVAQVRSSDRVAFAQRVIILQPSDQIESSFLAYRLMTESTQRAICRLASGSTALGVKQSEFRKVLVAFPRNKTEQLAVAARMKSVDDFLIRQTEVMSKLDCEKHGLMQDLLTGKVQVRIDNVIAEAVDG